MDPSTTLVTFFFETHPSVKSVQLIGSWDNFSTWYTMKHDTRRGRGQWSGCHSFKSIFSEDESHTVHPSRNGGLKMGHTYYYYTHRSRSASVSSLRQESYMTMDPEARFFTPVPPPSTLDPPTIRRPRSASPLLYDHSFGRSESVGPSWKRFFSRTVIPRLSHRPNTGSHDGKDDLTRQIDSTLPDIRPSSLLEGHSARDISPESLRRISVDNAPPCGPTINGICSLNVSSKLDDQRDDQTGDGDDGDGDGDENFAISEGSEIHVAGTSLSPPPLQRSVSPCTVFQGVVNSSSLTLTIKHRSEEEIPDELQVPVMTSTHQSSEPVLITTEMAQCDWSPAVSFSTFATPMSSQSLADGLTCFYDSDDDDDILSNTDGDYLSHRSPSDAASSEAFQRYSLPRHSGEDKVLESTESHMRGVSAAPILAGRVSDVPVTVTNFLGEPIDTGLDDFANELGLMAEVIGKRQG
ncbi:hypothetical protein E4U43_004943 [Claviceps pusilla]|uniref:Uncharacterized protein n=1 Tax=Claviceps pusilla TaxID=123648 RepID=A0A9P7NES8_9HYPO|nr:hypothetical protein E4U43_004943 [Claviceps pusilla]